MTSQAATLTRTVVREPGKARHDAPPVAPIPIELEVPAGYWEHDPSHFPQASYAIDAAVLDLIAGATRRWVSEYGYLFDGLEFRDIGGWAYQRVRPLGGKDGPVLPDWLMWVLVRVVPEMRRRTAIAREAVRTDKPGRFITTWHDSWMPELASTIDSLKARDLPSLSDTELDDHLMRSLLLLGRGIEVHALVHGSLAPILFELVTTCERLLGWETDRTLEMVRGTSFKSTEPARRLSELAAMASERLEVFGLIGLPEAEIVPRLRELDAGFAAEFDAYLDGYGHRSLGDSIAEPTIAERPSFVLGLVRDQLQTGYDPARIDAENDEAREAALSRARQHLRHDPAATAEFERLIERARRAYPAREDNEFYTLSVPIALLRYAVLELGDRLGAARVIDDRDDVLHLTMGEARAALGDCADRREVVARRKGQRAWAMTNPGPRSYGREAAAPVSLAFMPEDARLPMQSMLWSLESMMAIEASKRSQANARVIRGTGVSEGSYRGPVRLIKDESEFGKLHAGDVLVCPTTSPVWSVLFASIGALVTDSGGVLSHPAIIAREYRIPGVVATGNATSLLRDGQLVTVDGAAGTVTSDG